MFAFSMIGAVFTLETCAATTTIVNNTYYLLQNVHSGMFLEVEGGYTVSGTNIQQYTHNGDASKKFLVLGPENGVNSSEYHQIAPMGNTNLRLDVANASNSDGANISLFVANGGYGAQSFKFIANGDGSFRIMPYLSSTRVLGIENNSTALGANVELVTWTGHNSQRWVLKKVDQISDFNWSYFFQGTAATTYRNISQRISSSHVGIDVPAPTGTPVYSPTYGRVHRRGLSPSMGNYVMIQTTSIDVDAPGRKTLLCRMMHMNEDPLVGLDDLVNPGTPLGYIGNTGESYGAHMHIDVNNQMHTNGDDIRNDLDSVVPVEQLFPSVLFTYSSGLTYA